ncbi:MAG: asparagine synthase (glutamine-hydrolyzing) [Candidatus Sumerlaeia bacterium]|nr:asparagine synthase (glutamine-hydrolyzing) [Candidatus Sumerlaeia bacterium]
MCGIVGYTLPGEVPPTLIGEMADILTHRGPDDHGVHVDQRVALGHRRLSIQDLSSNAAQPMVSRDGRVTIVYNGECYNNDDLRKRLHGVPWRSTSDTETLLEAYIALGPDFIGEVNGMFALAVYDMGGGKVHLYRDRMGEKPLFYHHEGPRLVFASELKAIIHHPAVGRDIDRAALRDYLLFNHIPGEQSILCGVGKVPPGGHFTFNLEDGSLEQRQYWTIPPPRPTERHKSLDDATDALEELLLDAVDRRRISDVPLGCFLSGGIDSSTIAWALAARSTGVVKTFTIGFRETGFDESPHAEAVARHLGTEHHCEIMSEQDALELLPLLPALCDEPFADASLLPTALLCRMTRKHVTVALSGDGGDELFLGYDRYRWAEKVRLYMRYVPGGMRRFLAGILMGTAPYKVRTAAAGLVYRGEGAIYPHVFGGWSAPLVSAILGEDVCFMDHPLVRACEEATRESGFLSAMGEIDATHYLPDDILVKVDRAAMAYSLEARVPLLDHRLVEFAHELPTEWRMDASGQKRILRNLLYRHVPRDLMERPKAGFAVPLRSWFRCELKGLLLQELSPERIAVHGMFQPRAVAKLIEAHLSGKANYERVLWALLVFQLWHREFLE